MILTIKKGIKRLLLVIVLFFLTIFIINTDPFDEKLRPEVVELLKEPKLPAATGNAFYASMGLLNIIDADITQAGLHRIQKTIENSKQGIRGLTIKQNEQLYGANSKVDLFWQRPIMTCEMVYNINCLSQDYNGFYSNSFDSQINNPRLQTLLQRFDQILEMDTYKVYLDSEIILIDSPYSSLRKLGEIQLINKYKNYSSIEFLKQLHKNLKFWKMVLTQGDFLIDKMVAFSQIRRDVLHLSEFLRAHEIKQSELVIINKILEPLSSKDMDLSNTFKAESKHVFKMNNTLEESYPFYDSWFYQPNATNNAYYEKSLKPQIQLNQLPLKQLIQFRKKETQKKPTSKFKIHYLYNYMGKLLIENTMCICDDYMVRAHDTANMIKLVSIQLQLKLDKNNDVSQLLAKAENLNPYDDKPFTYNKADGIIKFKCLDKFQECKVKL